MSQAKNRIAYLFNRARAIKLSNLREFAGQAKKVSRKPKLLIMIDMLWCSVRYELGFRDYAVWDFAILNKAERETWMTHPKSFRLTKALNGASGSKTFEDKFEFFNVFSDLVGREQIRLDTATESEVQSFLSRHKAVIAKVPDGFGGSGISRYETQDLVDDLSGFIAELKEKNQVLLEQFVTQDPIMRELYPDSVNTIRMITIIDEDNELHIVARVLRIGNGGVIDNFAAGGMYTMLDENGVALYPGVDRNSEIYHEHPVTGVKIVGFQVPQYEAVLALLDDAARRVPDVRYVGWDIALTETGPILIEGNHNSSVFQAKPSASGIRTGLVDIYQEASGIKLGK